MEGKTKRRFFREPTRRYNTKEQAIHGMKEHLPKGDIFSQAIHAELYESVGLFWKHHGCYIRDTRYYTENGEDLAYATYCRVCGTKLSKKS